MTSERETLTESLRQNAELLDKATEFMSDPEQIEEAKADIDLWRKAADEFDRLERIIAWYWRHKGPYPSEVDRG